MLSLLLCSAEVTVTCVCRLTQTLLWHHRLGHPSLPRLRGMHSLLLVSDLPKSLPPLPPLPAPRCLPYVEGWQCAAPHSSSFPPTTAPLQTLHMDVWGPARVSRQGRGRYFLLVVDDYTRYTTVFPLRSKGRDLSLLRLLSDRGGEFSSNLLWDFCRGEGILQSFTLPASPQQNGIAERHIGLVMEVARTSMIHAAAPRFLWPFAVLYAAHQLNLWPRASLPETSPTLRWTGKLGDASVFRVWGSRAFVRDTSTDKLSTRAIPYVFLGFPPDAPGLQFYHPTSRRVFPSHDVTFDELVPFYHLFPYRSTPPQPPPLFLAPGPPPVDPLPPQGPAPSGMSQVDPLLGTVPVEVAVASGAARGAACGGAASGGAEPRGAESEGARSGGAVPGGAEPAGAEPAGVEPRGAEPEGVEPGGAESEAAESGGAAPWAGDSAAGDLGAGGAIFTVGAGGTGGTAAAGPGGARTKGTRAAGTGSVGGAGAGDLSEPGGARAGGAGAGGTGAGGAGAGGVGAGDTGAVDPGAGGAGAGGAVSGGTGFPLPAPSLYAEQTDSFTERREPESRPSLPVRAVRTGRRVPRPHSLPGSLRGSWWHRKMHRDAAKRVLRYFCSTSGMGLVLGGRCPVVLTGHANASWVEDLATQRSSQGYTFSLGDMAAQELRWLTYLLTDLGEQPRSPLQRGQLRLAYVATRANTADIFTKALPPGDHQCFSTVLGLVPTLPHLLTA
ncbi:unnamed protein product [Closterium sp. NIES-53]